MSVVKVIELMADSKKSWEDAIQTAVLKAGKTIHNIKSVWVQDQSATIVNNKVSEYRVTLKLSFELDQPLPAKK
ncbi:MAG: dodecin domain-containing protein [Terrimonas sp.]|nr:dodecin domain-containing protein [Terrimonas sp.]